MTAKCSDDCGRDVAGRLERPDLAEPCYRRWVRAKKPDGPPPPPHHRAGRTPWAHVPAGPAPDPAMRLAADPAVTRAADALSFLARNGDRLGARRMTEALSRAQVDDLLFMLAASADRRPPARRQRTDRQAHAEYNRLSRRGVQRAEMPAWVTAGERAYMREAKRLSVARLTEAAA